MHWALSGFILFVVSGIVTGLSWAAFEADPGSIRVEVFLGPDQRDAAEVIRERFAVESIRNVHFQFFRAGHPPSNIAIGREIPAGIARLTIQLALQHNRGVKFLVLQELLPPTWIGIGTSAFDELSQIPISPEALQRLRGPGLTTEQFHHLYRQLAQRRK